MFLEPSTEITAVPGKFFEVVDGGHGAGGFIVVDVMALVDRLFILIVGAGGKLAAADAADQFAVLLNRFDGLEGDVVGMVVVVGAEAAAHDAIFGDLRDPA